MFPNPYPLHIDVPALPHRQWLVRRLLPATGVAIVAQTGNMYNGLWYPGSLLPQELS